MACCGNVRPAGVFHEWMEVPWNWVSGATDGLFIYTHGFSKVVYVFRLQPIDEANTRLYAYFDRSQAVSLAFRFQARLCEPAHIKTTHRFRRWLRKFGNRRPFSLLKNRTLPSDAEERLISIVQELRKIAG